jgi:hypothetical protein
MLMFPTQKKYYWRFYLLLCTVDGRCVAVLNHACLVSRWACVAMIAALNNTSACLCHALQSNWLPMTAFQVLENWRF